MRKPRRRAILKAKGYVRTSGGLKEVVYYNPSDRRRQWGLSSNRQWEKHFRYFARRNKLAIRHRSGKRGDISTTYFSKEFREMCRVRVEYSLLDLTDATGKKVVSIGDNNQ